MVTIAQYKLRKPLKAANYVAAQYGLVPDDQVGADHALGDPVLRAALAACRAGDWKPAKTALSDVGTDWNRRDVYVNALGTVAASFSRWLDFWREAEPSSPDAAVVYAQSLVVKAWKVRGAASAPATTRAQFEGFQQILRTCSDEAMKAAEMVPEDPTPWATMVIAARGLQWPNEQFERIWQELLIRDPLHRRAHTQALQYWQPKWLGSWEQASAFVADTDTRAPHSALAFELRLGMQLEMWLAQPSRAPHSVHFRRGAGRGPLRAALDDYSGADGTVPTGNGQAMLDGNWLAWALTMANRWDEACQAWSAIGGCRSEATQWLYELKPDSAFTELRREAFVMSSRKPNQPAA